MNIRIMLIFAVLLSISSGLLLSSHAVEEIPSSTLQEGKLWEDIRIGIIVNKVEKAVVLPPEIIEELSLSPKEMPKPAKGNDLVCIQLTIVKIKNVHVISLGGRDDEKSFLTDDEGHKYSLNSWNVKGVEFLDPSHLTGSYEFIEGSRCILLFEMPKRKEPVNLTFLYCFKEAWEDALSKKGQIDIKISISGNKTLPGYNLSTGKVDEIGKSPEKIDTQNTGAINLTSTPFGAKVFLDTGQYIGKTPLTIDKTSPGKHKVTLVLADYEKYVQEVDVIAGKVIDVSATLIVVMR